MDSIEYTKVEWKPKDASGNVPDGAPAINAPNLNRMDEGISACAEAINEIITNVVSSYDKTKEKIDKHTNPVVLWTNNAPNASMSEINKQMDLSEYKRFVVLGKASDDYQSYVEHHISYKNKQMCVAFPYGDYTYSRNIEFTDSGFSISKGYRGTSSSYNSYAIIVEIIGYKY